MTLTPMVAPAGALGVHAVSKTYPGTRALDTVSFSIAPGTVHALLGGNGSGKSTLVKILAGVVRADPGSALLLNGRSVDLNRWTPSEARAAGLRFVHQDPGLLPGMSVAENLALGCGYVSRPSGRIDWPAQHRRSRELLDRFRIAVDTRTAIDSLSPATQTMIAIARALADRRDASASTLVLDEPTASLPREEVDLLLGAIRNFAAAGQAIVMVSHRLDEVLEAADDVTVLRDGRHVATRSVAGLSKHDLATLIAGHDIGQHTRPPFRAPAAVPPVLTISSSTRRRTDGINLSVRRGEIVGIAGLLGSGRSSLLRTIFGAVAHDETTVTIEGRPVAFASPREAMANGLAYVPEDRAAGAVFANLTVRANLSISDVAKYWGRGHFRHAEEARESIATIARFGIKCAGDRVPISTLSGGNQQKVVLARALRRDPRLLLLDEPTQGVDVGARAEIAQLIHAAASQGTAVLVASSDFEELIEISDTIAVVADGRIVDSFPNENVGVRDLTEAVLAGRGSQQ